MNFRSFARRWVTFAAVSATAFVAACKDGSGPLVPSTVQIVAGDQQTVAVGTLVPVAPSVKVLASNGKPVPNVKVTFAPAAESGTVVGGSTVTNATGVATVTSWTVGTHTGPNTLSVTAEGLSPITITANTSAGAPAALSIVQGDLQVGLVGSVLPTQPAVRVADAYGNPVANVAITFAATAGAVQTSQTVTNSAGQASAGNWTLGTKAGNQSINATANVPTLQGVPVSFVATATADVATSLKVVTQPSASPVSGLPFTTQPVLEFRDRFDNTATSASNPVTVSIASGNGTLSGTTTINAKSGLAAFTNLAFTGSGAVQLRFSSGGFSDATSSVMNVVAVAQCAGTAIDLNMQLGEMTRYQTSANNLPRCLDFSAPRNNGQQYLVMFENISPRGSYSAAAFPGTASDDGSMFVTVTGGANGQAVAPPVASANTNSAVPADAIEGWDFGGKSAFEIQPKSQDAPAATVKRNGQWISTESSSAALVVGDTIRIQLEGIPRLGIPTGMRSAVVKLVSADIIIAEDTRFSDPTFTRTNGSRNTPIAASDLQEIATEYSAYAKVQADRFFSGRYNGATEQDPGRPIAVHTMMYSDNIWGYTYSSTNYFAWDYWVNSSDGRTKDVYQHAQRNADDLFMHEIAHMRHYGMLERAGRTAARGNQWLVEGFARFTERLPIASRLLGGLDPSRTNNLQLPLNPVMISAGRQVYFFDDVPTYLSGASSMYGGYGASSFVFDYFADQVAKNGGQWMPALQDFLVAAGSQTDLDGVINRYLPGLDFGTLFTRARIALYLDDIGTAGLPAWTQYWMYNLRLSRPPSSLAIADPRNQWPKITPGVAYSENRVVDAGGAFGYVIDGSTTSANGRVEVVPTRGANGVMTIVRIK